MMQRREFMTLLGGASVAWSLSASALPHGRVMRVGVLMGLAPKDPESRARITAFMEGMQQLGWARGQNISFECRWADGDAETMRKNAAELVSMAPDIILAHSSAAVAPLLQKTRTIPIVFTIVADPVGAGFVNSLARPGGNATGFTNFEYSMSGKWLELLKEMAPNLERVGVLREAAIAAGPGQFGAIQSVAARLGVELRPIDVRDAGAIERDIAEFALGANGGLIVTGSPAASVHRDLIIKLASRHRLPTIYNSPFYVNGGGLIAYGPDFVDQFRRAATYVDRILKGESPSDLPVQAPTKYEMVLNLKAAKSIGVEFPTSILIRADEVVE